MDRKNIIAYVTMVVVLIVLLATLAYYNRPYNPGGSSNPVVSMTSSNSTQSDWTVTVIAISSTGFLPLDKVNLTAKNMTDTVFVSNMPLSNMTAGVYYNGMRFVNSGVDDRLSAGDFFMINKTVFKSGFVLDLNLKTGPCAHFMFEPPVTLPSPVIDSWSIENGTRHPHLWVNASCENSNITDIEFRMWLNGTSYTQFWANYTPNQQSVNLSVTLDLSSLPSGTYDFYIRLVAKNGMEGGTSLRKMVLI